MSKASEFAKMVRAATEAKPPQFVNGRQASFVAEATTGGELQIRAGSTLNAVEALKLARWIIDTFEDAP